MSSTRESGDLQLSLAGGELVGTSREPKRGTARMYGLEKSDELVVPKKPGNSGDGNRLRSSKTSDEGPTRGAGGGKEVGQGELEAGHPHRTQGRNLDGQNGLQRVGAKARDEAGRKSKDKQQYTNLMTHLRVDLFREVYLRLKKRAAPGIDGQTWAEYGENLEARLQDLQDRVHRGGYRPPAARRTYIPKADGRQRPLGIPTIEDKILQGAVQAVLTPIYEVDFLESSYGFRPGRNQHDALDGIDRMLYRGKVNWVLDADIQAYFDTIDHDWLMKMLEHRLGDTRLLRLIRRWLTAGIMEEGELRATDAGTPQGGKISPLLANVYLHYGLDLWAQRESRRLRGTMHVVRYADDFLIGFQYRDEAIRVRDQLEARLRKFNLVMHPEKTHLLRFGQYARRDCHRDGLKRPETFVFLGFTHICGRSRRGRFCVVRRTAKKKRKVKLSELKEEMRRRMHWKLRHQWRWLCSVLRGHYQYYAVSTNYDAVKSFRETVRRMWHRVLQRRSQRARMTRRKLNSLDERYPLPKPRIIYRHRQLKLAPLT
jgi:group II intron reverse transcriptase/maturase